MKTLFSSLFFDKELVKEIRTAKLTKETLYARLLDGKITLQEYLAAIK